MKLKSRLNCRNNLQVDRAYAQQRKARISDIVDVICSDLIKDRIAATSAQEGQSGET